MLLGVHVQLVQRWALHLTKEMERTRHIGGNNMTCRTAPVYAACCLTADNSSPGVKFELPFRSMPFPQHALYTPSDGTSRYQGLRVYPKNKSVTEKESPHLDLAHVDEVIKAELLVGLRVVRVGVEHYEGKGQQVSAVG